MFKKVKGCCSGAKCGGCGYFLGLVGAAAYYLSVTEGLWPSVVGLLKALVWPAFLVFGVLKYLGA